MYFLCHFIRRQTSNPILSPPWNCGDDEVVVVGCCCCRCLHRMDWLATAVGRWSQRSSPIVMVLEYYSTIVAQVFSLLALAYGFAVIPFSGLFFRCAFYCLELLARRVNTTPHQYNGRAHGPRVGRGHRRHGLHSSDPRCRARARWQISAACRRERVLWR